MFIPSIKVCQHASADAVISVNEVIVKDIHEHVHKWLAHKFVIIMLHFPVDCAKNWSERKKRRTCL